MAIWHLFVNEVKQITRSPVNLILLLLMPVMMICLMGYAMKPVFNMQAKGIEGFRILLVNEDQGETADALKQYLRASRVVEPIDVERDRINEGLESGEFPLAVILPDGFSQRIVEGALPTVEVVGTGKDSLKENIVKVLLEDFIQTLSNHLAIRDAFITSGMDAAVETQDLLARVEQAYQNRYSSVIQSEKPRWENMSSEQYFSVTMLIFFLLAMGTGLGASLVGDRESKIQKRISSYPVTPSQYLLGKALGVMAIGFVQSTFIILTSMLVFGVKWGTQWLGMYLVVVLIMLFSLGIATMFSSLISSVKGVSAGLTTVFWMITFISGGFFQIPSLAPIAKYTLNHYAFESIAGFMSGSTLSTEWHNLIVLAGISAISCFAGILLYRRRALHE